MISSSCLVFGLAFLWSGPADARYDLGVPLHKKFKQVGPHRYRSHKNFIKTVKYYSKQFKRKSHKFNKLLRAGRVKVQHIRSNDPSTLWEGINISYYWKEITVFIIKRGK